MILLMVLIMLLKGTDDPVKGNDNAVKGTDNAVKGTDNAVKGTDNAVEGTDKATLVGYVAAATALRAQGSAQTRLHRLAFAKGRQRVGRQTNGAALGSAGPVAFAKSLTDLLHVRRDDHQGPRREREHHVPSV
jgi:hypothetical protein